MVEPLTASAIVFLFFSGILKEAGKALGKGVTDKFTDTLTKLVSVIWENLKAEGTEGLLIGTEKDPTVANKTKLQDEL